MISGPPRPEAALPKMGAQPSRPAQDAAAPTQPIHPRDTRQTRLAQAFAQVVAVMMHDANFKQLALGDLEWLVLPALKAGQFRLGHMQTPKQQDNEMNPSALVPICVALWARVSPEIDKRLSDNLDRPAHLSPDEWTSGDRLWLMVTAGEPRAIPAFLRQLAGTEFKGKEVKLRRRGADGKVVVSILGLTA